MDPDEGPVRTLAVCCADWPVVATGRPPTLPVAVVFANRVVAASPAARAEGVVPGLRRREAQARCPSVELHERDESQEARAFERVLIALEDLAPRLEVVEAGRCLVPTRGPSRYHGGDRALAEKVVRVVRTAGADDEAGGPVPFAVGVGIADGPRAATLVAEEALRRAVERGDPAPVVVGPGATASFLSSLPVARLSTLGREPEELVDVLRRLGLRTLGRFAALPAPDVLARFGALGADLHRLASGRERLPPDVAPPPVDLRVSATLDPPVDQVDRAAFTAKSLADTLHDELASRGLACTRVLVVAETEVGDRIERWWRADGALSAAAIGQRVRWQLEGWLGTGRSRSRCTGGISRLELVPDEVRPDEGLQLGFWGGTSEAGERALRALARVQALVGADGVLVPEWQGGRSPGEQYRLVPLDAVDLSARAERGPEPWPGALPSPSPAVVWPRPRPVEVLDAEGRRVAVGGRGLISAPPARVHLGRPVDDGSGDGTGRAGDGTGRAGDGTVRVRAWAGPWCVDERWWDAVGHRRRARLQVVLEPDGGAEPARAGHPSTGAAHLLTLEDGRWWLEATYD
ncbi:DNA polymerase Y family protein [Dermatobacter hominis]|uniref:DNA polymerase Y family protein n=1 Tax=Dermatobacter hominis TaxID=2884263 RepID=UPI001D1247BE|nr:DNA polymerase Y family protein [Dermatobacter hominis]UDY37002.1 DNA polymerase Y family protein [Dermatobacter hominis]